jgi:hypothetical protein
MSEPEADRSQCFPGFAVVMFAGRRGLLQDSDVNQFSA